VGFFQPPSAHNSLPDISQPPFSAAVSSYLQLDICSWNSYHRYPLSSSSPLSLPVGQALVDFSRCPACSSSVPSRRKNHAAQTPFGGIYSPASRVLRCPHAAIPPWGCSSRAPSILSSSAHLSPLPRRLLAPWCRAGPASSSHVAPNPWRPVFS
jgi:hypothetical protein